MQYNDTYLKLINSKFATRKNLEKIRPLINDFKSGNMPSDENLKNYLKKDEIQALKEAIMHTMDALTSNFDEGRGNLR